MAALSTATIAALGRPEPAKSADLAKTPAGKAADVAREFEEVYLANVLSQLFTGLDGEGPMGAEDNAGATWRSFLTDQYAKEISAAGGVGLADGVLREILRLQEGQP